MHNHGTFNVEITNSTGLSKEDMEFMMGTFKQGTSPTLEQLELFDTLNLPKPA